MKKIFILVLTIVLPIIVEAQELEVAGRLFILDDIPVQNVKVTSLGTGQSTKTNINGAFKIISSHKDYLIFEAEPLKPTKVRVNKRNDSVLVEMSFIKKNQTVATMVDNKILTEENSHIALKRLIDGKDYSKYPTVDDAIHKELPMVIGCCNRYAIPETQTGEIMLMICNNFQVDDITSIPTSSIAEIVIVKGPDALRFGRSGAANGVLVVKLKNGDDNGLSDK